jgi:hypothetical protein
VCDMSATEPPASSFEDRVHEVWLAHPPQGSGAGIPTAASSAAFTAQQFNPRRVAWKGSLGIIVKAGEHHWRGKGIGTGGRPTRWAAIIEGWERQFADRDEPPEVADMLDAADQAAGRRNRGAGGQGYRLPPAARYAVEWHAVEMAADHLLGQGWPELYEVGAIAPYDLLAIDREQQLIVEVKGTTSAGEAVVLTRREVEVHGASYPGNALIVVHSIELDYAGPEPVTAGGVLVQHQPWRIEDGDLQVVAYRYRTPHVGSASA